MMNQDGTFTKSEIDTLISFRHQYERLKRKITPVKNLKTVEWMWVRQCAPKREMLKRDKQYFRVRGYDPDEIIRKLQDRIKLLIESHRGE